jgi:hypothetical protein
MPFNVRTAPAAELMLRSPPANETAGLREALVDLIETAEILLKSCEDSYVKNNLSAFRTYGLSPGLQASQYSINSAKAALATIPQGQEPDWEAVAKSAKRAADKVTADAYVDPALKHIPMGPVPRCPADAPAGALREAFENLLAEYWFWNEGLTEHGRELLVDSLCALATPPPTAPGI